MPPMWALPREVVPNYCRQWNKCLCRSTLCDRFVATILVNDWLPPFFWMALCSIRDQSDFPTNTVDRAAPGHTDRAEGTPRARSICHLTLSIRHAVSHRLRSTYRRPQVGHAMGSRSWAGSDSIRTNTDLDARELTTVCPMSSNRFDQIDRHSTKLTENGHWSSTKKWHMRRWQDLYRRRPMSDSYHLVILVRCVGREPGIFPPWSSNYGHSDWTLYLFWLPIVVQFEFVCRTTPGDN